MIRRLAITGVKLFPEAGGESMCERKTIFVSKSKGTSLRMSDAETWLRAGVRAEVLQRLKKFLLQVRSLFGWENHF